MFKYYSKGNIVYISRLALDHFRSWQQCIVDFQLGVNILQGPNGIGKTNIIEAIEVLSTGTSHRTSFSLPLVQYGEQTAIIRANVNGRKENGNTSENNELAENEQFTLTKQPSQQKQEAELSSVTATGNPGTTTYELTIAARGAKRARINGGSSQYMRDIVGQIPSVTFSPEDQQLISSEPGQRRTFLNQAGALLIPGYAEKLQAYSHIAKQRVALLKKFSEQQADTNMLQALEVWTGQLIENGVVITEQRADLVERLSPLVSEMYGRLSSETAGSRNKLAEIRYQPSFEEIVEESGVNEAKHAISQHFRRLYPGELSRGQNLIGPHRDDIALLLSGMPAKDFASNGETWTFALALKMALYQLVSDEYGTKPIVILDDVFAQLDETRRSQILAFANSQEQVIITVAAASDIPHSEDARIIDIEQLHNDQNLAFSHGFEELLAEAIESRGEIV